ncbi:MAG: S66 peptidase family protein [archaeon]
MKTRTPPKLRKGDTIRVIAPANSMSGISKSILQLAEKRFQKMGIKVTYSAHARERNHLSTSSVEARLHDLHEAFEDEEVNGILAADGGYASNSLLHRIEWKTIRHHPKIFGGYSDITAMQNAILAQTGIITYSGPLFSNFGQKKHFDYTLDYFKKCVMHEKPFSVTPATHWSNDNWYTHQDQRKQVLNKGWTLIQEGTATGTIVGGNLSTLKSLFGTDYFPSLRNTILFIEDDYESKKVHFDRDFQSLLHQREFKGVKGVVIGRFEHKSKITDEDIHHMIHSRKELETIPVISHVDFGHTDPMITFPIGGTAHITAAKKQSTIRIIRH